MGAAHCCTSNDDGVTSAAGMEAWHVDDSTADSDPITSPFRKSCQGSSANSPAGGSRRTFVSQKSSSEAFDTGSTAAGEHGLDSQLELPEDEWTAPPPDVNLNMDRAPSTGPVSIPPLDFNQLAKPPTRLYVGNTNLTAMPLQQQQAPTGTNLFSDPLGSPSKSSSAYLSPDSIAKKKSATCFDSCDHLRAQEAAARSITVSLQLNSNSTQSSEDTQNKLPSSKSRSSKDRSGEGEPRQGRSSSSNSLQAKEKDREKDREKDKDKKDKKEKKEKKDKKEKKEAKSEKEAKEKKEKKEKADKKDKADQGSPQGSPVPSASPAMSPKGSTMSDPHTALEQAAARNIQRIFRKQLSVRSLCGAGQSSSFDIASADDILAAVQGGAAIIDLRSTYESTAVPGLQGAVAIPWDRVGGKMNLALLPSGVESTTHFVLYCNTGKFAAAAQEYLASQGFKHTINAGGPSILDTWKVLSKTIGIRPSSSSA